MKNKRNIILLAIFLIVVIWAFSSFFKEDTYIGFYYPDANNLTNDIQSKSTFDSLEVCRDWVDEQINIYNQNDSNYDHECGKNCNISGSKPYVCEETLE
jgi:hypothetical protein